LIQILTNFASNAVKYNRPGGKVTLSVILQDPGRIRFMVSDTGIGIRHDKQDKLFQPFQRAGQENGTVEGSGIGLFIAKRLAELMHGSVGFRSVLGHGSDFWVDLPTELQQQQQHTKATCTPLEEAAVGGRVLLHVEDNPANLAFMRDVVVSCFDDVQLLSATTGELGVVLARTHNVDAILMDINLPGMSGLDALHQLRSDPMTQHIPVIAVSAAASEHDKQRGLHAGFYAYLTKPMKVEEFVGVLTRAFSSDDDAAASG